MSPKNNALVKMDRNDKIIVTAEYKNKVGQTILSFLDTVAVGVGQATYYNTREEQKKATEIIHKALFHINRGLYTVMLLLPGVNDYNIQLGILRMLNAGMINSDDTDSLIEPEQETRVIEMLARSLPPQRLLKMFEMFRKDRINNRRTRRLILKSILCSNNFPLWCVKYRTKVRNSLVHAWGRRQASALCGILEKPKIQWSVDNKKFIKTSIDKYLEGNHVDPKILYECICFVLGGKKGRWTVPLIKEYNASRFNLEDGKSLPRVVLEGMRGRFFDNRIKKDLPEGWEIGDTVGKEEILKFTKNKMDVTESMRIQRKAKKANVDVKFNPIKQNLVNLYVYALEQGLETKVLKAIKKKAATAGKILPIRYNKVGIVIDTSISMFGKETAKRRPMAIALATRDILQASALKDSTIIYTGDVSNTDILVEPKGETSLAEALIESLENEPDVVFILTDGYENAPAGRVNEVLKAVREIGINTPVYQMSPIMSAESAGVKQLSKDINVMSIAQPEALGVAMIRVALAADLNNGIQGLLNMIRPRLNERSI